MVKLILINKEKTMKKFNILILCSLLLVLFATCKKSEPELGVLPDKSTIKYSVTQDLQKDPGGNTVVLQNQTPGTISLWDYGTGTSTLNVDTIHFAFKGDYIIKFSALTRAGIVKCDSVVVSVTADNLNYVNDTLWTYLTGGVGKSKTWILDNGKYGLASGPLSYADPSVTQVWGNFTPNWEPDGGTVGATATDYQASMTFSLSGGPYLTTVKPNETTGNESGTFFLDKDNHTLSTSKATIIRLASFINNASNWTSNVKILVLNENQLRIAIYRTNSEGPWWYIFNYVSKTYADNYVPAFKPDPNFNFGDQMSILAGNSVCTWRMDTISPFDWAKLDGTLMNNWTSISSYPSWTGYNASAVANIKNIRITFARTGDVNIINNDGTINDGYFSLNATKNLITFSGVKPNFYISGGWVYATTSTYKDDGAGHIISGDNQWKIVKIATISSIVTDVWFGQRQTGPDQYMVYHFKLNSGIPDVKEEMIKGLCGDITGTTSRTFKVDLNWPVDWTDTLNYTGWTVSGTTAPWYWSDAIANSVKYQTMTFSQTDGVVTATKRDEQGNITTSPVTIDGVNRQIIIPNMDIIQFGAGSWLPSSGLPTGGHVYKWVRGEFNTVETDGFWIGVRDKATEYTAYHYILK
jgi:hypothetical protein